MDTGITHGTKFVVIIDEAGYMHYYAHLSGHFGGVRAGDRIRAGQQIGWLGISGNGPIPHLHYQIYKPKADPTADGTGGFSTREIDREKENPFSELARLASASGQWFEAETLRDVDQGLDGRYQNRHGDQRILKRIVLRNGALAQGVAAP